MLYRNQDFLHSMHVFQVVVNQYPRLLSQRISQINITCCFVWVQNESTLDHYKSTCFSPSHLISFSIWEILESATHQQSMKWNRKKKAGGQCHGFWLRSNHEGIWRPLTNPLSLNPFWNEPHCWTCARACVYVWGCVGVLRLYKTS